ncbi:MAG: protein kinase family protein [Clostridiales bacterium]|jgi:serine/threonine protein kinase|nr:protein kinase family protein [Clostridiales bacterium]
MPEIINPINPSRIYQADFKNPLNKKGNLIYPVQRLDWMKDWPESLCIKRIRLSEKSGLSNPARFRNECDACDKLPESPYLVKPLDHFVCEESGKRVGYIVMERFDMDLRKFLAEMHNGERSVSPETLKKIFLDILLGLKELSKSNIIHRDVKAGNVFLTLTPNSGSFLGAKIGDFDTIKDLSNMMTPPEALFGTVYENMPPEVFSARSAKASLQYDMYGAGMIWLYMFDINKMMHFEEYMLPAKRFMSPSRLYESMDWKTGKISDFEFMRRFFSDAALSAEPWPKLHHFKCPLEGLPGSGASAEEFAAKLLAFDPKDRFNKFDDAISYLNKLNAASPATDAPPAKRRHAGRILAAIDGCFLSQKKYAKTAFGTLSAVFDRLTPDEVTGFFFLYENCRDDWRPWDIFCTKLGYEAFENWCKAGLLKTGFGKGKEQSALYAISHLLDSCGEPDRDAAVILFASGKPLLPDGFDGEINFHDIRAKLHASRAFRTIVCIPDEKAAIAAYKRGFSDLGRDLAFMSLDEMKASSFEDNAQNLLSLIYG